MNFFGTEIRTPTGKSDTFERYESAVRSYCRSFPAVFSRSLGARIWDETGAEYLDFLMGAGALNYGHNNPTIRTALVEYLEGNGIVHALDLHTQAKRTFIEAVQDVILRPRGLNYRLQFTGPTGTNAIEAALKLARKVTGRHSVIAFTNAFHGMSLGALAASGTRSKRDGAGVPLTLVTRMPFDRYAGDSVDTLGLLEAYLDDPGSGVDLPAAIILETLQAEGGIHIARPEWLAKLAAIARRYDILLILDEIQTGCGRTGPFFSFERAKLNPDIVCLSKSISGYGLPLSLVLIKPDLDVWAPGEHNGTFRGNNLAFVAGASALDFWRDPAFERSLAEKGSAVTRRLRAIARETGAEVRGIGLLQGLHWSDPEIAPLVSRLAFERGLIVETCSPRGDVLKLLPPLTIDFDDLDNGLDVIEDAARAALRSLHPRSAGAPTKPAA